MYSLHAGIGSEACVHRQHNTGDSAGGLVVAQEQRSAQQLVSIHKTAGRCAIQDLGRASGRSAVLIEQQSLILSGYQEAGGNGIAADAGTGKVGSQPLSEVGDTGLTKRGILRGSCARSAWFSVS